MLSNGQLLIRNLNEGGTVRTSNVKLEPYDFKMGLVPLEVSKTVLCTSGTISQ